MKFFGVFDVNYGDKIINTSIKFRTLTILKRKIINK